MIGLSSALSLRLLTFIQFSKLCACSNTPDVDASKATFALYPKSSILAVGSFRGKKSLSHNLSPFVQVFSAWKSLLVGFRPWTAMMLLLFSIHKGSLLFDLLDFCRTAWIIDGSKKVPRHLVVVHFDSHGFTVQGRCLTKCTTTDRRPTLYIFGGCCKFPAYAYQAES